MSVKSVGYQQSSSVATAQTLAQLFGAAVPTNADYVVVQCETQNCRWRDDGVAPTASVGNLLTAGDSIVVRRGQFSKFQIIQVAATAVVNVDFYHTG